MAIGNPDGEDLMAKYIGTAYDDIKFVADNLDAILAVSVDIDAVNDAVTTAEGHANTAAADAVLTAADVLLTAADVLLAAKWADEAEDVVVSGGAFSAKHHAIKAAASAASISSILDTSNTFSLTNTYEDKIVLSNTGNLLAPLEMTSTGAVGIKITSDAAVRYLGVDDTGAIRYGANPDHVSNPVLWTAADINDAALPFAASVLTVATSATVAGFNVHTTDTIDKATIDFTCKDLVVANTITINGETPYTPTTANTSGIDWACNNLTVAADITVTGVVIAAEAPTLDTHLANKLYVDAQIQSGSVTYEDNVKLLLGTGDDLEIYHTGVTSNIDNNTGNLVLTNKSLGDDIGLAVTCDDGNLDTVVTLSAGATAGTSKVQLRYGDLEKIATAADGVEVTGLVSATAAPTDNDHLTRKDYVDTELTNQTHTMSEVSGNVPVSQVPVAVNNASAGNGFGGFRYTTADAGATLNLFTT